MCLRIRLVIQSNNSRFVSIPFTSDTCHFQKLQEENKSNEYDFHWNTSPTSIVCAFPYIIAFTSDTMEIRLLVNGNLVHTVTMDDLQLITSKRDIYFATTAPEFIPKDFRIGCLENEQITECDSRRPSRVNEFSNERILEIRHKIEKVEIQASDEPRQTHADQPKAVLQSDSVERPMHINSEDSFSKFLPIPRSEHAQCIQRARSLQKPRDRSAPDDQKRLISKSNSCGDSCGTSYQCGKDKAMALESAKEPSVPPNSPKVNANNGLKSPSKGRLLRSPLHSPNGTSGEHAAAKCKPLRIFRIPLSNLTGAHSHYHTHSSTPRISTKKPPRKIVEDDVLDVPESAFDSTGCNSTSNTTSTNGTESTPPDNFDNLEKKKNLKKLTANCVNLSLFSSI